MSITQTFKDSFKTYAGYTIMDRAICDARDMLKPSARMSIYAQYIEKITPDKPYKKAQKSVAAAMDHFYVHGDMSLYSMLARLGKPFAMRYVIEDFQGNTGTIESSDNEAASRYTEMRLAPLAMNLFTDIEKNTIIKWYDNYDGEEQYPGVLPSKGFYNIVNGSEGIATGISSSIPQLNLREVNEALIKLLNDPKISDDELICMPDFSGGGILLNASEVRRSLKEGHGASCRLRSVVNYDSKNNRLIITETPYGVYTETIMAQLGKILESEDNPGIDRFLDFSTTKANIEIDLKKDATPERVIEYLYKNTSIQDFYPINLIMLDNGKVPKLFTWKEALQAHLDHEKVVYRRGFEYDLSKLKARAHILDGYIIVLASIDEVVKLIKSAASTADAKDKLCKNYLLDADQATAVLKLTLSRLTHLEVEKIKEELATIEKEIDRISKILSDVHLMNAEIERGLKVIADKYGDDRRTEIRDIEGVDDEPAEIKTYTISITNKNNLFVEEYSSLMEAESKKEFKFPKGEYIISSCAATNKQYVLLFADNGTYCGFPLMRVSCNRLIPINAKTNANFVDVVPAQFVDTHLMIVTKLGHIKLTALSEYKPQTRGMVKGITLAEGDSVASVETISSDNLGVLTSKGKFLVTSASDITPIGKNGKGVNICKLEDDEYIVSAHKMPRTNKVIFASTDGYVKIVEDEYAATNRTAKGTKFLVSHPVDFIPVTPELNRIKLYTASNSKIITVDEIPTCGRATRGTKLVKLTGSATLTAITPKN